MKLDLNQLFEMFEQLEKNVLSKDQDPTSSLQEQDSLVASEDKILKYVIPKIELSQRTLGNNEVLKSFASQIIGNTLADKLNGLNIQLTKMGKIDKRGQNLQLLIEKVAILDALRRMFYDFDASPAGFLNEAFVAAFFKNGKVEPASTANKNHLIQDVSDGDKKYSLKTLGKSSLIGGSAFNLCNTVWNYGEVTYLLFEKVSGEGGVTAYALKEYVVNKGSLSSLSTKEGENMARYYERHEKYFHKPNQTPEELQEKEAPSLDNASPDTADVQQLEPQQPEEDIQKVKFSIPRQMFGEAKAVVNFSTQQALIDIKEMVGEAILQIEELHKKLDLLTRSVSQYFVTTDMSKKQQVGKNMIDLSEDIKPKTKEIVEK